MRYYSTLSACALSISVLFSQTATAQINAMSQLKAKAETIVAELKSACEEDFKSYCANVTTGEARIVFCMLANEDKISSKCVDAVIGVADRIEMKMSKLVRTAQACETDINKSCNAVRAGDGRLMQCIRDHQDKLSSACGIAIKE
jgi:hypothetical protein